MAKEISATAYKRSVVIDAIKKVAPKCKANFEIPMSAYCYIMEGNRLRKKPVHVSYDYVSNLMHEMIRKNII